MKTKLAIKGLFKPMPGKIWEKILDWAIPILTAALPTVFIWLKTSWKEALLIATFLALALTLYLVYRAQKAKNGLLDKENLLLLDLLCAKKETDGSLNFNSTSANGSSRRYFAGLNPENRIDDPIDIEPIEPFNNQERNSYTYKATYTIKLIYTWSVGDEIRANTEVPPEYYKSIIEVDSKSTETDPITKGIEITQQVSKGIYPKLKVRINFNRNPIHKDIPLEQSDWKGFIGLEVRLIKITILNK